MRSFAITLASFGMAIVGAAHAKPAPKAAEDFAKIQGTWVIASGYIDGKPLAEAEFEGVRCTFTNDRVSIKFPPPLGGYEERMECYLDPSRTPKSFNLIASVGEQAAPAPPGKDTRPMAAGIYELAGDELKVCYTEFVAKEDLDKSRPKTFDPKTAAFMYVLKREKK